MSQNHVVPSRMTTFLSVWTHHNPFANSDFNILGFQQFFLPPLPLPLPLQLQSKNARPSFLSQFVRHYSPHFQKQFPNKVSFTRCGSNLIQEQFVVVTSSCTVQLLFGISNRIWNLSESCPLRASSVVLGGFFYFLWLSNCLAALSCVNDPTTTGTGSSQPLFQPLLNHRVSNAYVYFSKKW